MARVEISSMPWGVLQDRHGESQNGATATLKNLNGTNATTWSAVTGGSSSTASLTADSNGNLPRFVEGGQYTLDVPALGVTGRRVEAVSGSVESDVVTNAADILTLDAAAAKQPSTAIVQYVTATGNDANDGKSWGKAKLTVAAAYTAAAAAGSGSEVIIGPGSFNVTTRIDLKDGVSIRGAGIGRTTLLAVSGIATAILAGLGADTASDLAIRDMTLDCASLSGINGVQISTGARNLIERVKATNCNIGVNLNATTDTVVQDCWVLTAAAQGIQSAGARNTIQRCLIDTVIDTGIALSAAADNKILDNRVVAVGISGATKHGMNISASPRTVIRGNYIAPTGGMGICGTSTSTDLVIQGNVIDNSGSTLECIGLTSGCTKSVVSGNKCMNGKDNGISVSAVDCAVTGNVVSNAQFMGIQINGGRTTVSGNVCKNNGQAAGATPLWAGIDLHACNDNTASGNVCYDDQGSPTQQFGVVIRDGTANNNVVTGNNVRGNVQAGVALSGTPIGTNNTVAGNYGETVSTVASAATITLPAGGELVTVSGTTTITSVTASYVGRRVTLIFSGVLTFTDGSNLKLAGNFVTTADDTISLVCDGTNWVETARSVN